MSASLIDSLFTNLRLNDPEPEAKTNNPTSPPPIPPRRPTLTPYELSRTRLLLDEAQAHLEAYTETDSALRSRNAQLTTDNTELRALLDQNLHLKPNPALAPSNNWRLDIAQLDATLHAQWHADPAIGMATFSDYRNYLIRCTQDRNTRARELEIANDDPALLQLIADRSISERWDVPIGTVMDKLKHGDLGFGILIRKKIDRQGLDEFAQINWLRTKGGCPGIVALPKSGQGSKRFYVGTLNENPKKPKGAVKSLDARDRNTYYILKYTSGKGGAQTTTHAEVNASLKAAVAFLLNNPNSPVEVCVCVDGSYWDDKQVNALRSEVRQEDLMNMRGRGRLSIVQCKDIV